MTLNINDFHMCGQVFEILISFCRLWVTFFNFLFLASDEHVEY